MGSSTPRLTQPVSPGDRYGRWTVLSEVERLKSRRMFLARCDCGTERVVASTTMTNGTSQSCGCLRRERSGGKPRHGHSSQRTPTYHTWTSMHARCRYPYVRSFEHYGGRGITVCDRWRSFENFLSDMGERPPDTSIDRIDPDGNYEPSNCRWATAAEQQQNRRVA